MINSSILKARREQLGMSLEALASASGLSKANLHRLEKREGQRPNANTIGMLCKALKLTPEQLAGTAPIDPAERAPDPGRWTFSMKMTKRNRNALSFVATRYGVVEDDIIELAPLLFHILAQQSLKARRQALAAVEEARLAYEASHVKVPHLGHGATCTYQPVYDALDEEDEAIRNRELFHPVYADKDDRSPFAHFLNAQLESAGDADSAKNQVESCGGLRTPYYSICSEEASNFCNGDEGLIEALSEGWIGLHEIPRQLRDPGRKEQRLEWMRTRLAEVRQNMEDRSQWSIFDLKPDPSEDPIQWAKRAIAELKAPGNESTLASEIDPTTPGGEQA